MDAPLTGSTAGRPRRPRISLRAMLVVVMFLGCWLGWLVHRARVQKAAVDSVERISGEVLYEWQYKDGNYISGGRSGWPRWLVSTLGVDYLDSVVRVIVTQDGSDAVLHEISGLGRLEEVIFTSSSPTDNGLARLGGLTGLRYLDLSKSGVTDAGLSHLGGLTSLRWLIVKNCPVGDTGLCNPGFNAPRRSRAQRDWDHRRRSGASEGPLGPAEPVPHGDGDRGRRFGLP